MTRAHRQRGFSLATAIFLLIVLALLGTFMLSLSTSQHYTTLYSLQGARAYQAANAGIEWGIARVIAGGTCPGAATFSPGGSLTSFSVQVTCSETAHQERGNSFNVYTLTAVASSTSPAFGEPGYASRELTVTVTDAPSP